MYPGYFNISSLFVLLDIKINANTENKDNFKDFIFFISIWNNSHIRRASCVADQGSASKMKGKYHS